MPAPTVCATSPRLNVAVVGAGVLGRLLAWALLRLGHGVNLFDAAESLTQAPAAGDPARAAGWTAAGMLSPTAELECANAEVFAAGLRSIELWPLIQASLPLPGPGFELDVTSGSLLLAHRDHLGAAQRVVGLLAHKAPASHAPRRLTGDELRALEPDIHGPAHAWLLPGEGRIHTPQALLALGHALHHLQSPNRLRWVGGCVVQSVQAHTVTHALGTEHFDWVLDVRGCGANGPVPVLHAALPSAHAAATQPDAIRGVRGEVFTLHAPGVRLGHPVRLLHPRWRVYVVPRQGDHVVVGATEIESADRSPVSVRSALELLSAAHSVLPGLAEARIVASEANLRPALPDNLPRLHQAPGLTQLNGLFRHGWLLAPALVEQALEGMLRLPGTTATCGAGGGPTPPLAPTTGGHAPACSHSAAAWPLAGGRDSLFSQVLFAPQGSA